MKFSPHHFSTTAGRVPSAALGAYAESRQRRSKTPYLNGRGSHLSPPKRVLVIDDDEELRVLSAMAMTTWGFEVDTADNGEAGWQALCHSEYDLVITDHNMPELTGLDLIRRLRAVSFDVPCILISGQLPGSEEFLMRIVRNGKVLRKPFQPSHLISEAEALLLARQEGARGGHLERSCA